MNRSLQAVAAALICAGLVAGLAVAVRAAEEAAPAPSPSPRSHDVQADARTFLNDYQQQFAALEIAANRAYWKAANSGRKEDFDAAAEADLAMRKFHSDPQAYERVRKLVAASSDLPAVEARALRVAELAYQANQLPAELLEQMVALSSEIERTFNTYRAQYDGQGRSNNDLLDLLRTERDSARRQRQWEALKQVGDVVAPRLIELARLRNQAATRLGFANFWDMQIRLQEHDPQQILTLFDELERLTRAPFTAAKAAMDREQAERLGVAADELMPWHYDNPFFQDPPPGQVDTNDFYADRPREEIVEIARKFYRDIGLPADEILRRSDLYDREGKNQHAFCIDIDRAGDVRTLCNVKPTAEWMDTVLHELGHGVYNLGIDPKLPYNLRNPAHAFTTEGVAMLLGALGKNPTWMTHYAGVEPARIGDQAAEILEQRRRAQLVFARWTIVMLQFEKGLYENPDQNLNDLWWRLVERSQQLRRPPGRNAADWAAKPHFTIAPVYYHNYMLGELFAAQLRAALAKLAGHEGPIAQLRFEGRRDFGRFLQQRVFAPGNRLPWPEFVTQATGEPLTARHFAAEVSQP